MISLYSVVHICASLGSVEVLALILEEFIPKFSSQIVQWANVLESVDLIQEQMDSLRGCFRADPLLNSIFDSGSCCDLNAVKSLVLHWFLEAATVDGLTALHFSCEKVLISFFLTLPLCECLKETPCILYVRLFLFHIVSLFSDVDCARNTKFIAPKGNLTCVEVLLQSLNFDFDVQDVDGATPLHVASEHGYFEIVDYLLRSHRCNPNAITRDGETPLHKCMLASRIPNTRIPSSCVFSFSFFLFFLIVFSPFLSSRLSCSLSLSSCLVSLLSFSLYFLIAL